VKKTIAMLVVLCFSQVSASLLGQSAPATPVAAQDFSWSAELVALDEAGKTITIRSRAVPPATTEIEKMKAGDKILLVWSGSDRYADAVRSVQAAAAKPEPRFTFPVEYVSYDAGRQYVTFKVPIPANSIERLKSIKPGEWVTATSPHGASSATQPITAIRHYNDPPPGK